MIKTITFRPSRIGCPSIPGTIKGIIASMPGVETVKIHYEERSAEVTFDDTKTNETAISKKIGEEMGLAFEAVPAEEMRKENIEENVADTCPM